MLIGFYEKQLEDEELELWTQEYADIPDVDLNKMEQLMENPPIRCDEKDECVSYYLSGDNCRCVRSLFPHQSHYFLYKNMVEEKIKTTLINCITEDKD